MFFMLFIMRVGLQILADHQRPSYVDSETEPSLVGFILAHGARVLITAIRQNTNYMFGGVDAASKMGG